MKRIFAFLLTLALCFSLSACATENKYAELEKMLDEGRYGDAMTYILSLQAGNSSSVPLFGIVQPGDGTYTDEDLDADKEPDAEVLALIDELMGEWVIAKENEEHPQKFIFREDGTCTVDGKEMTWEREAISLSDYSYATFLSVWEGETERYRVTQPAKSDAGELSFTIGEVDGIMTGYGSYRYICPANYEVVELTMDNWQEYFEFTKEPYHSTNAFGDVTGMGVTYYFTLKEEYFNRLSKHMPGNADVELRYATQRCHARINSDGITYSVGDWIYEPSYETEVYSLRDYADDSTAYFGAEISYGSLYMSSDTPTLLPGQAHTCRHSFDFSLLRIQGTLYLLKEQ